MRNKMQLLLALTTVDGIEGRLASEARSLASSAPAGCAVRVLLRAPDDPTRTLAHGQETAAATEYGAVIDVGGDDVMLDALATIPASIGERLAGFVDASSSAAVVGTEHVIVPGSQPVVLVMALRRLPTLTSEYFHEYWLHHHAEVARGISGLQAYLQFHADLPASRRAAAAAGFGVDDLEGCAEGAFQDMDYLVNLFQKPEISEVALADERRFIDHSRSPVAVYRALPLSTS